MNQNQKKYFKVRHGFGNTDFVSIEAGGELERVVYAWSTGGVVSVGDRMINGNNIISIEPHYHRYTGWYDSYEPKTGDDWAQIERDCPSFDGVIGYFKERVQMLIQTGRTKEIGKMVELPIKEAPLGIEGGKV